MTTLGTPKKVVIVFECNLEVVQVKSSWQGLMSVVVDKFEGSKVVINTDLTVVV